MGLSDEVFRSYSAIFVLGSRFAFVAQLGSHPILSALLSCKFNK